ncbi:uroporphyrinogen decarboxylase [Gilvimarinus agarilyticus]|uniref:uroporphyrinogen decarboxylase n=1 Tax=unclassified Gilvimarinus TaxID=2642066 RepID=UPI001C0A2E73|nr:MULTISPECIES: uroporphyrinogen decarboxylase [unclassified Gilvimarinus]MBU2886629.1 uroporphyrinogen decarboxylase [Gilvimarinus agarilyticus]MDO6571297.1 uroporphyrinogen decarboxylase [Gilvimarinus sp. 2_MG-2023]MDO6746328.1 uroporphyrinogen decarboxylase [Gilvimarinus sp. 1_MG-2023]
MSELKNDRFLRALLRQPVDMTPVWMMRQAGRYLPEYRASRAKAGNFMGLCGNPEMACEVTMQPLERYPLDAAILFSDILTIPDAMGLGLYFETGEGPKFKKPVRTEADINALKIIDPHKDLPYVVDAVSLIRRELNGRVPLIGFSGSPWTLATYMIEGGSSKDFRRAKQMMYNTPELMHQLLDTLAESVIVYLNAQIEAGAQAVQIFDTWGGALSHVAYQEFSLHYMNKIVAGLIREREGRRVPVILFTKGGGQWLESMADTGADALGLDWTTDMSQARARVGDRVALQGNMDPTILYASPERIREEVKRILGSFGPGPGHVFNLGHGITPEVDPEHAGAFIRAVHEFSSC